MNLFTSPDQCILIPTIGFVKDNGAMYINISWLWFGLNISLWTYSKEELK